MDPDPQLLLVTGFGPFRQHLTNPSWAAVQELKKLGSGDKIRLETVELPVHYQRVREILSRIWETQQPQLAVHVGVGTASKLIILEQCARNQGYKDPDVCGCYAAGSCCVDGGPEKIESLINMRSVCKNLAGLDIAIIYSRDAGRYLCEYAYYLSLYHGNQKAAFIHIPRLSNGLTVEKLGKALWMIPTGAAAPTGHPERTIGFVNDAQCHTARKQTLRSNASMPTKIPKLN